MTGLTISLITTALTVIISYAIAILVFVMVKILGKNSPVSPSSLPILEAHPTKSISPSDEYMEISVVISIALTRQNLSSHNEIAGVIGIANSFFGPKNSNLGSLP